MNYGPVSQEVALIIARSGADSDRMGLQMQNKEGT